MIQVFSGENSFEIERALESLKRDFSGTPESYDGALLTPRDLPNLLMGVTLFADKRLIVIRGLSDNNDVWKALPSWLERVSDDVMLVLVEAKLDKRTAEYKALKAHTEVREFPLLSERDSAKAVAWVIAEAKDMGVVIARRDADFLVRRIGVSQWELFHALQVLAAAGDTSEKTIEQFIDARSSENIFALFETALSGNKKRTSEMLKTLVLTEDPYMLFGLLSSQAVQLAAVAAAGPTDKPAKDFGINESYVLPKYKALMARVGKAGVHRLVAVLAQADADIKISKAEPWILIERALLTI